MQSSHKIVQISVELHACRAHLFKITMAFDCANPHQRLSLPVWTPGSYMVREFAQHIVSISAIENGQAVAIEKLNKNTFELKNQTASVVITYDIYGFDSSIRAAFIDSAQAFFNGTALFLRPHTMDDAKILLMLPRPIDEALSHWQVATGMPRVEADAQGFGTYSAQNFQELIDYPFQISDMKRLKFNVMDVPHEIVLVGDVRTFDNERLIRDLGRLCEEQIALFGTGTPFKDYLFIARFEEGGHGGLEHSNSSMLLASPYSLPKKDQHDSCAHYRNFLSLCSHEYFHAWNVKRLKPSNFIRYDLDKECYTTMLWIFEGLTAYYDDLLVKRAGLMSASNYLELLGKHYTKLLKNKGRHLQSLAESSFDAWIKFYRQNENSVNASVSYYLKGSFVGLYLDLLIRQKSDYRVCLDDVMRSAFNRYGDGNGITEEQFFSLLDEVGKIDAISFKQKYVYGKEELPIASLLDEFGVDVAFTVDELYLDDKTKMSAFLGFKIRFDENDRAFISFVEYGGPAMLAGMSYGDEVMAINGIRLDPSNAHDLFGGVRAEETLELLYARKKVIRQGSLMPTKLPIHICKLSLKSKLEQHHINRLGAWIGSLESKSKSGILL